MKSADSWHSGEHCERQSEGCPGLGESVPTVRGCFASLEVRAEGSELSRPQVSQSPRIPELYHIMAFKKNR